MPRVVQPELLDTLPVTSVAAQQSRRDLQRINGLMAHAGLLSRMLKPLLPNDRTAPWRVAELGAGDASFSAKLSLRLPSPPAGSRLWLVDQQSVAGARAVSILERHGWQVERVVADANHWLHHATGPRLDAIYANLFVHHFADHALRELLASIASRTHAFATLEPRRGHGARLGVRGLRLIRCHPVTLHDALRSVWAGFADQELSRLWPESPGWRLREKSAGLFSHGFAAHRFTPL